MERIHTWLIALVVLVLGTALGAAAAMAVLAGALLRVEDVRSALWSRHHEVLPPGPTAPISGGGIVVPGASKVKPGK